MKMLKKGLSLLLCAVMVFSCAVTAFAADDKGSIWDNLFSKEETTEFSPSVKYYTNLGDSYGAGKVLDWIDTLLKEKDYSVSVKVGIYSTIKIDLTSINSICKTIDDFCGLLKTGVILLRPLIKDLADLDLNSWTKGLRRGDQDIAIAGEFIDLLYNNRELIRKLCDGTEGGFCRFGADAKRSATGFPNRRKAVFRAHSCRLCPKTQNLCECRFLCRASRRNQRGGCQSTLCS